MGFSGSYPATPCGGGSSGSSKSGSSTSKSGESKSESKGH
jgi:hypothetical protein